jgi:hypothetical protein
MFVIGGVDVKGNVLSSIEVLDLEAGTSRLLQSVALTQPVGFPTAVVANCLVSH